MKRKLSILLVVAMILSMLPTSAFAASKTNVSTVTTTAGNSFLITDANVPKLYVTPAGNTGVTPDANGFLYLDVVLNNAEWTKITLDSKFGSTVPGSYVGAGNAFNLIDANVRAVYVISKTKAQFVLNGTGLDAAVAGSDFASATIALPAKVLAAGAATATVNGIGFTTETVTFAVAGSSGTVMSVSDVNRSARKIDIGTIVIEETTAGTFRGSNGAATPVAVTSSGTAGNLQFTLTTPGDFEWGNDAAIAAGITVLNADYSGTITAVASASSSASASSLKDTLLITIPNYKNGSGRQAVITVNKAIINVGSKATEGEVKVNLKQATGVNMPTAKVVVGQYADYGVLVTAQANQAKEIIAGYKWSYDKFEGFKGDADDNQNGRAVSIVLDETVSESWWSGRKTVITMPHKDIRIKKVIVEVNDNIYHDQASTTGAILNGTMFTSMPADEDYVAKAEYEITDSTSSTESAWGVPTEFFTSPDELDTFTLQDVKVSTAKRGLVRFTVYADVPLGYGKEELVMTVGGPALDKDTEVTVAKIIQPIKLVSTTNEQQLGYKGVVLTDVDVVETFPGAIQKDTKLTFGMGDNFGFTGAGSFKVLTENADAFRFTTETTSAKVGNVTSTGANTYSGLKTLELAIRNESAIASSVQIVDPKTTFDRTWPEGDYKLEVKIANISNENKVVTKKLGSVSDSDYVKIVTPAMDKDGQGTQSLVVTAGSKDYTVGVNKMTAPVAAFTDSASRMQVPVRAITEGLGYAVNWSDADQSVTITAKGYVVQFIIGSKVVTVNGVKAFEMDTTAQLVNDSTFVPLRGLAQAINVGLTFDDAKQAATFNPNAVYTAK